MSKKFKKVVATGLTVAMVVGVPSVTFAESLEWTEIKAGVSVEQVNEGEKESRILTENEIQSIVKAIELELENTRSTYATADFTIDGEWERMAAYIGAAVDRVNGLCFNGVTDEATGGKMSETYEVLDKVNRSYNSIVGRVRHAISGLEVQFNYGGLEGKEIAVRQLDQIIKEETELNYEYVNETTINSATKILDAYKLQLELARAVHEANMTNDMIKNADFTQGGQWELMASYIGAAVARVDGVRYNGIENDDTKYVYDTLDQVNRRYNSIVGRIQHAISSIKIQFEHGGKEGQAIALGQLEQIIKEEKDLNYEYVNATTIHSAEQLLKAYEDRLAQTEEMDEPEVQGELMEQLKVAVGEAATAKNHLDNADFTKSGEWEYMSSFIAAAVDRVNGIVFNGIENEDTKKVYDTLDQINRSYNSIIGRVQHAINGLEVQFNYGGLEGKEIAVKQLEQIIKEETELNYEYVNKTTINSATKILDAYKLQLELARAVHEANMTNEMIENADFTQGGQWELMASYIGAAVARVDGVRYNGIENEDTQYVYDTLDQVNRRYNSIVGRIQHAISGVKVQFEQGGEEGQQIALDQLETIIGEENELGYVNRTTIESARLILNQYRPYVQ